MRHTYATNLLDAGAKLVDIKALLGHSTINTTQIYTHVGQKRMEQVVARLRERAGAHGKRQDLTPFPPTNLLNAGAELVDIKALLGHESVATPQIDTHVGQERMSRWWGGCERRGEALAARVLTRIRPELIGKLTGGKPRPGYTEFAPSEERAAVYLSPQN